MNPTRAQGGARRLSEALGVTNTMKEKRKREIRQLWAAVEDYFEATTALRNTHQQHLHKKPSDVADLFSQAMPSQRQEKDLNLLLAHLSSISVRLFTINEIFEKQKGCRILPSYEYENICGVKPKDLARVLANKANKYIHDMLRHNVAHSEPTMKTPKDRILWKARQLAIESLTIEEIYNATKSVMEEFRTILIKVKII